MANNETEQPIVRTHALTKQVNTGDQQLTILQNIDLNIHMGEAVAIIGASGSGKSTLLGLLAGLDLPTSGKVHLDEVDIFALDEDQRAALRGKILGFVFQSFQLLPALTALENVMLPLELMSVGNAEATARRLLDRVGLALRLHHHPKQLSGGEQQRVAIARAFATAPKLLLADEPTGNLDSATGIQIIELMFELNREHGTTLVLVTHDEALSKRCSRQLRMADGRLMQ
ncbi:ATP-binding cassette domain-containing protein [Nitrosomonas sp. JL21]|uniref:ABC transporter ATP-binding protein n=1 Tax=Nitrosomonas sp. JL21 TaxID=153949 RepID=UPI00136A814F|nr:ATP-binding cassette domain-containing protein [Nitrosomonas sp. JL21]MBL8497538.1 ATP-binding cassette domain-containing protein [Nitrosomonas sp.]MCC7091714.1 ATP-binding cassette domain-containing protein [Nitrosomonas sp.]MXS78637.1 ATP-binding cassette domain-containing protein [Nitrosomonas sp. JL21]